MTFRKSVTIKDVAQAAGVSAQTVSRVLNNRPDVSEDTRQHILTLITDLGYSPNIIARSLISGHSNTLGVVSYGVGYYGPSRILTGIERHANELGYSLAFSLLRKPEINIGEDILTSLLSRKVDGIIWAVPEIGNNRLALLASAGDLPVPIVFINMQPRPDLCVAAMDNYSGGRHAAMHLLSRGCRHVGIITGPENWWESVQREAGWRSALLESGQVTSAELDCLRVVGDWYPSSGDHGLEQLLQRCPDLDAVFACNDPMALGVLQAARRLNRRVPDDLAVVGYDDIPEASYFYPPLTTIRQPLAEMGSQAVRLLHHILSNPKEENLQPEQIWFHPELVVRASSAFTRSG